MKTTTYREDGSVEVTDSRLTMACLEHAIARLDAGCRKSILDLAPQHSQINAALGILDDEKTAAIVSAISLRRARYRELVDRAKTIAWDGRPRAEQCDELDMIQWSFP